LARTFAAVLWSAAADDFQDGIDGRQRIGQRSYCDLGRGVCQNRDGAQDFAAAVSATGHDKWQRQGNSAKRVVQRSRGTPSTGRARGGGIGRSGGDGTQAVS